MTFMTESGVQRAGLLEVQSREGRSIVLVWVRGDIVYVDAAPLDPESPGWVDAGFLAADGKVLLDAPGSPCQWRRIGGTSASRHAPQENARSSTRVGAPPTAL
jgi:hypothetical protein